MVAPRCGRFALQGGDELVALVHELLALTTAGGSADDVFAEERKGDR